MYVPQELGYAGRYVNMPALKAKHKLPGTKPALKGAVGIAVVDPNGKAIGCKRYHVGFRVRLDEPFLELIHVEGESFPQHIDNHFDSLKTGVKAFLAHKKQKENNDEN